MKTIVLYGELAKRFGKYHRFAVKNAAEAIRALKANFRGFEQYMAGAHLNGVGFRVFVGGSSVKDYPNLADPAGKAEVIRLVPVLMGSGNGWVKIFIGAVLVAGGILVTGLSFGAAGPLGTAMIGAGLGLIIGGVATLLTKPPSIPGSTEAERKTSHIFNGPENTAVQGKAVPVGYGRMIVGSCVISAGIETYDGT